MSVEGSGTGAVEEPPIASDGESEPVPPSVTGAGSAALPTRLAISEEVSPSNVRSLTSVGVAAVPELAALNRRANADELEVVIQIHVVSWSELQPRIACHDARSSSIASCDELLEAKADSMAENESAVVLEPLELELADADEPAALLSEARAELAATPGPLGPEGTIATVELAAIVNESCKISAAFSVAAFVPSPTVVLPP